MNTGMVHEGDLSSMYVTELCVSTSLRNDAHYEGLVRRWNYPCMLFVSKVIITASVSACIGQ